MAKIKNADRADRAEAILAKCHECCGYYTDGKNDCGVVSCPLYTWMPFSEHKPDLTWKKYDSKRPGCVLRGTKARWMSEEEKKKRGEMLGAARKMARESKNNGSK